MSEEVNKIGSSLRPKGFADEEDEKLIRKPNHPSKSEKNFEKILDDSSGGQEEESSTTLVSPFFGMSRSSKSTKNAGMAPSELELPVAMPDEEASPLTTSSSTYPSEGKSTKMAPSTPILAETDIAAPVFSKEGKDVLPSKGSVKEEGGVNVNVQVEGEPVSKALNVEKKGFPIGADNEKEIFSPVQKNVREGDNTPAQVVADSKKIMQPDVAEDPKTASKNAPTAIPGIEQTSEGERLNPYLHQGKDPTTLSTLDQKNMSKKEHVYFLAPDKAETSSVHKQEFSGLISDSQKTSKTDVKDIMQPMQTTPPLVSPLSVPPVSNVAPQVSKEQMTKLINYVVDQISLRETNFQSDTTITVKNLPLFEGATITVSSYKSARGEINISFDNLTQHAKNMLDLAENRTALQLALDQKGYTVHIITTATVEKLYADNPHPTRDGQPRDQSNQQQSSGQEQRQGRHPKNKER